MYVNQYLTIRAANGALLPTKHVYLGDSRVASKVESNATASNTYWYHSDQVQSTEYVTTANQIVVQHLEYYPGGGLRPSGKRGLPGDIRLVAIVECKGRKAIQLAVPALCEWVEVDGMRAPFDPVLLGLLVEKVSAVHRAEWSSRARECKQDRKAPPGGH